jgi:hypothetical protein
MESLLRTFLFSFVFLAGNVVAEVTDVDRVGFTIVNEVIIDAGDDVAWRAAIDDVGLWWNSDHTISGDASRLSITPVPLGCFCERFSAGAGVVHLTVTMVNPGVVIRLTGGLGPLGLMGVNGNMTWEFEAVEDGTKVRFTYTVGGYSPDGLDSVAGPVDYVIGEALTRLKAYVEADDAANSDIG